MKMKLSMYSPLGDVCVATKFIVLDWPAMYVEVDVTVAVYAAKAAVVKPATKSSARMLRPIAWDNQFVPFFMR